MKESSALQFYGKLETSGLAAIEDVLSSSVPVFETDWLEFKGAERIGEDDVKSTWSKTLSAFANTQGGVLIWGLDARHDPSAKMDCVCGSSLVQNTAQFMSRLQQLAPQATDPPISGVKLLQLEREAGKGYVVAYVPEGVAKPYRAELAGRNYYIRAGAATVIPSPALLRSLFYPESHAQLWPETRPQIQKDGAVVVDILVHNSGVATAKEAIIGLDVDGPDASLGAFANVRGWSNCDHPAPRNSRSLAFASDQSVHPGAVVRVAQYQQRRLSQGFTSRHYLTIHFALFCADNQPRHFEIDYTYEELDDKKWKLQRVSSETGVALSTLMGGVADVVRDTQ